MKPPRTGKEVLELVRKSGVADAATIDAFIQKNGPLPTVPGEAAAQFFLAGILTELQAEFILKGKPTACRLGKNYVLLERLGYATGELFHALHTRVERRVTIQILPQKLVEMWAARPVMERIHWSGPPPTPVEHPNVVRTYDIDQDDNQQFVVMEQLEGKQLPAVLEQAGGRLPVGEACGCALQVATGLKVLHEERGAHERITPDNLFVCENGTVKILNHWAIRSRWQPEQDLPPDVAYTAPEQHLDSYRMDRCDCYSLGVVLYRMICAQSPYTNKPSPLLMKSAEQMIRDGVPPALVSVLARMMAKKVENRYQSMTDVIEALRPFVEPATTGDYPEMAAAALAQT